MDIPNQSIVTKEEIVKVTRKQIEELGFTITETDKERPWGAFFVIEEKETKKFIKIFFDDKISYQENMKYSPKILIVEPKKKLSWQYHHRRSEIWRVIKGPVGIVLSDTDTESETSLYNEYDMIEIKKRERHRLIGLEKWGIVAEIWMHTDANIPSNEEDIVRVQDDFSRK